MTWITWGSSSGKRSVSFGRLVRMDSVVINRSAKTSASEFFSSKRPVKVLRRSRIQWYVLMACFGFFHPFLYQESSSLGMNYCKQLFLVFPLSTYSFEENWNRNHQRCTWRFTSGRVRGTARAATATACNLSHWQSGSITEKSSDQEQEW